MKDHTAYCGLDCSECPAYRAHLNDDYPLREKTAKEWSEMYKSDIKPDDVNCVGCTENEGVHFGHCSDCKYRSCARSKGLENCGHCPDYPCEELKEFFQWVPESKVVLDIINRSLQS